MNSANSFATEYTYLDGAEQNSTTTLIKTVKNGNNMLEYNYDLLGNITNINKNDGTTEHYEYDGLNQLTRVIYNKDTSNECVYVYTYDNGGNILSVTKDGEVIKSYTYGDSSWKDLLTNYNGRTITYDGIGNPLQYRNGTLAWSGRELSIVSTDSGIISYAYGDDSLRTKKTVYGEVTDYYWLNGVLLGQKKGDEHILFLYDENGSVYGMLLKNGTTEEYYYYIFNAQGDVIGIVDSAGNKVVEYTYSPWGEILSVTGDAYIGQANPLRYRGYYYDSETGFYYLQSRYYDPETGRFISADGYISTGQDIAGYNMFAYCLNNPVIHEDSDGEMASAAGILAYGLATGGANAWNPAGWIILGATVVTAVAIWVIPWDSVRQSISNGWNRIKNSARTASISRSISTAIFKSKTKIRNEKRRYDYWIASYVDYGDGRGAYIPTTPLSYSRAISYVRSGGSVFADSRSNAYKLAKAVGGGTPAHDSAHGELGYWRHYHATRGGRRIGGHVFYVA